MRKSGWRFESIRHGLAARGIKTGKNNYFATRRNGYFADETVVPLGPNQEAVIRDKGDRLETEGIRAGAGLRGPTTAVAELQGQQLLEKAETERAVMGRDLYKVRQAIAAGVSTVNIDGKDVDVGAVVAGFPKDSAEGQSVRAAIKAKAMQLAQAGISPPQSYNTYLDEVSQQQIQATLDAQREAVTGPSAGKRAKEGAKTVALGVLGTGELAVKGTAAGVKGAAERTAAGVGYGAKGLQEAEGGFGDSNPLLSDKYVGIANPLKDLEGKGGLTSSFDELVGGGKSPGKRADTLIEAEVDELYGAKNKLASVDTSSYEKGDKAFKEGNREKLIEAITDLESQEQLLADRWNLVEQTRAVVLSPQHRAAAYVQDDTFGGLFGAGGDKIAERTKKVNEVKQAVKNASNELYARRKLLRYKLQRMDATVQPESSVPDKQVVVLREQAKSRITLPDAVKPKVVFRDVYGVGKEQML